MQKDDTLITAASVTPEPDEGCASTCYYVGWDWDHAHTKTVVQEDVAPADSTGTR